MKLDSLVVLHLPKHAAPQGLQPFAGGFVLESCLRWIAVQRQLPESVPAGTQVYQAVDAYRFLLEVACGLHSKIQGESEIFGQLKKAWKEYSTPDLRLVHPSEQVRGGEAGGGSEAMGAKAPLKKDLHRLMQNLFADTKRIRTGHLHNIGGQSYAGAVQKLLHLRRDQHLLILGAGQFGAMLAEKLRNKTGTLTVMNRSKHALVETPGWEALEANIAAATHVLVALPAGADEALDARIQAAWKQKKHGKLLHLAQMTYCGTAWEALPHFLTLADVMALQNDCSAARPQAIAEAFTAVRQAAEARGEQDSTPRPAAA